MSEHRRDAWKGFASVLVLLVMTLAPVVAIVYYFSPVAVHKLHYGSRGDSFAYGFLMGILLALVISGVLYMKGSKKE